MFVISAFTKFCQKIFSLLLILLFFYPSLVQAEGFNAESFMLDNGMQVVLIENHRSPVVSHMVWYKVGAADEPIGSSGVAHFLEHLMFTGTKKILSGTFSETIKKHGGQDNAFTSHDYTAYYQNISVDKLPMVMEMEADRMQNLQLDKDIVARERNVVLEERSQRTDNSSRAKLREAMYSALFVNHPYSIPVIGWRHEIEQLNLEQAQEFYLRHYRPNNAILVVSGDVKLEELKVLAKTYYGSLKNPKKYSAGEVRKWSKPAPLKTNNRIILTDAKIQSPSYQKMYRAPRGSHALELLSNIIGEGSTSKLYKTLVVKEKLATEIATSYDSTQYGVSVFGIYARPAPNVPLEKLEGRIDDILSEIIEQGVTKEELSEAKNKLINASIYARDSLQYPAIIFGQALTSGFAIADVEDWSDNINSVTTEDVLLEIKKVFASDNKGVKGILLPENDV